MAAADDPLREVACPLCGSWSCRVYVWAPSHYGSEKLRVTKCCECGMIYTNPQSVSYTQEVRGRGVLERHLSAPSIQRSRRNAAFQLGLIASYTHGRRLLDFGCGNGALVKEAILRGWEAVGIDLNIGLVEAANRYWSFDALRGIALDEFLAAHPEPFDAIISNQVFEHLQDPLEVGKGLMSLLRPSGVLCLDVPNASQPAEWFNRGSTLDPTSHWNHFTRKTLGALACALGCRVVYCSASPSLVNTYWRFGLGALSCFLGRWSKKLLPPVGTGVCVIGQKVN